MYADAELFAIFVKEGGGGRLCYTQTDHLGSLKTVLDVSRQRMYNYSYDAWGKPRDPYYPAYAFGGLLFAERGFGGHEHLPRVFGLIDMNGRMYDPELGRFLSPDPYVQAPDFSQNFNRYSYCLNNPLRYTDPSGEVFGVDDLIMWGIIAYSAYQGGRIANDGEANPIDWNWGSGSTYLGTIGGGLVGWASFGVGEAVMQGGGLMANTMSFLTASHVNSVGMMMVSGGKTDYTLNFGFGSYNFTQGKYNGLFDGEKEWTDILYGIGLLGNLSDVASVVDSKINLEQRRIDEMQNHPATGELNKDTQGNNLFGHTYPGDPKTGPFDMNNYEYLGPIERPNWYDASAFVHDVNVGRYGLNRPGWRNLITSDIGRIHDWRYMTDNFLLGTKSIYSNPVMGLKGYASGLFFGVNMIILRPPYKLYSLFR